MNPLLENLVTSLATAIGVAGTTFLGTSPGTERDYGVVVASALVSFAGSFVTGMRQLHKDPKGK